MCTMCLNVLQPDFGRLWVAWGPLETQTQVFFESGTFAYLPSLQLHLFSFFFKASKGLFGGVGVGVVLLFLRQGFSVWPLLSWNSICRLGCPQNQRSPLLCLMHGGIKGVHHHHRESPLHLLIFVLCSLYVVFWLLSGTGTFFSGPIYFVFCVLLL